MFKKMLAAIARAEIFTVACGWLVVLLVIGTLAQRDLGLYAAQEKYFSSWVAMVGFLPLPGGRLTLLVVFLNLAAYLFDRKTWTVRRTGLLIAHGGALLLLIGGLLTAYFSNEGSMVIPEGQTSNYVADYRSKELALIDHSPADHDSVLAFDERWLEPGKTLDAPLIGGSIEVIDFHRNATASRRSAPAEGDWRGLGREFQIEPLALDGENENNHAGLVVRLAGVGPDVDGRYVMLEDANLTDTIDVEGRPVQLVLRRARTYLPFALELLDFEQRLHPGTRMAKAYSSTVNLIENGIKRRVVIQMNEPLRHHGYTFYQSSFFQGGGSETTVLAVVKNYGRLFPYISSLIMCFGLLVHLGQVLVRGRAQARREEQE